MAETVRGLTVEISADPKKFNSQMSNLRKEAKTTQSELNALQKSLELDFNSDTFEKAQKVAQKSIDETAENADILRKRLEYLENIGSVDTAEYKKLQTELTQTELKGKQLENQLQIINNLKFTKLGNEISNVGDKIAKAGQAASIFSAGAAAIMTGLGALGKKAISTGAELDDLSQRFGVSAEKIQEWQYIAFQTGVDVEVFNKALIKARSAMFDLASGNINTSSQAIAALGLSMEEFGSNEEMFDGIISALSQMTDKTAQVALANEIFGDKITNELIPFLNAGDKALQQFKDEFAEMSSLSNEQVAALASFDDVIFRIKESLRNAGLQIGASIMPLLKAMADYIETNFVPKVEKLAEWFNSLTLTQQKFALGALILTAAIGPMILMIGKLTTAVGSFIKIIPQIGSMLSTLAAHPIILIIAAVAGLLVLLFIKCEAFRKSIINLVSVIGDILKPVMDIIMLTFQGIIDCLNPLIEIIGNVLARSINILLLALRPVIDVFATLMQLLEPLINVALIPLQLTLNSLAVPLQLLGTLLQWLTPLFNTFGKVVGAVMNVALNVINTVLGAIEDAINWCINVINGMIDSVNNSLGWLGVHIDRLEDISLKIETEEGQKEVADAIEGNSGFTYDSVDTSGTTGDIYNYDYSNSTTTQNVTVTIENYASEVDVDDLVNQINMKLAEAM